MDVQLSGKKTLVTRSSAGIGYAIARTLAAEGAQAFFTKLAAEQGQSPEQIVQHFFESARPTSILKRLIDPAEVAAVVAFVCSPKAAAINGAAVCAEGGVVRCMG